MPNDRANPEALVDKGTAIEVFTVFLGLGLTCFGGPVAHLGYFREAFVVRHQWLGERAYADLVALCQFLPGPASSQVGMAIGLTRAGYPGLFAAWLGFTLPSALLLIAFAYGAGRLEALAGTGWILGLKAAAVGVVAHAVLGMARMLTPDRQRAGIALIGMIGALLMPSALGQMLVILVGGLVGLTLLRPAGTAASLDASLRLTTGPRTALTLLALFVVLLAGLPLLSEHSNNGIIILIDGFYRAGALVFGGGHVVLPLLQAEFVTEGMIGREAFLAGYGAAQAVPGPLFTFAAYLGAAMPGEPNGVLGATIALAAIFVPSALLVMGVLPFWNRLRNVQHAQRALAGINAAVVGLLAAALYDPVFTSGVTSATTMSIAAASFIALASWKLPAWAVVIAASVLGFLVL